MKTALQNIINDLRKQLESVQDDIEWHFKRKHDAELKAINLKETIADLEALKKVNND